LVTRQQHVLSQYEFLLIVVFRERERGGGEGEGDRTGERDILHSSLVSIIPSPLLEIPFP
jgi:hypothetical protein